jgi:hypothetical protein
MSHAQTFTYGGVALLILGGIVVSEAIPVQPVTPKTIAAGAADETLHAAEIYQIWLAGAHARIVQESDELFTPVTF